MKNCCLFAIAIFFLFSSCKKNSTSYAGNSRLSKMDVYINDLPDHTVSLQYDQQSRVTTVEKNYTGSTTPSTIHYEYFADSILVYTNNNLTNTYYLGATGLVVAAKTEVVYPITGLDDFYQYDPEGYPARRTELFTQVYLGSTLHDTTRYDFTFENRNKVKEVAVSNDDYSGYSNTSETRYTYTDITRPAQFQGGPIFYIESWISGNHFGKVSEKLPASILDGNGVEWDRFSYITSPGGRISDMVYNQASNGIVEKTIFHYE